MAGLILAAVENSSYQGPTNAASPNPVKKSEFALILAGTLKSSTFLASLLLY
jgi:NAD dependent epimerase/dehydratase family enzyme